jgi:predicted nucleotidyltransferase component of viral defense system
LRRKLLEEIDVLASFLEKLCKEMNLDFKNDPQSKRYFEFGGGGRMVTLKLWEKSELIKIQVNFVEEVIFPPKEVTAKTLLEDARITKDEVAYFKEFLNFYKPIMVLAYNEREILCEKVRAILTRRAQKLRDFYDVFMLEKHGFKPENLKEEITKKMKACLRYKKYRENLDKNRKSLKIKEALSDAFERSLFVTKPGVKFEEFLREFRAVLEEIMKSLR